MMTFSMRSKLSEASLNDAIEGMMSCANLAYSPHRLLTYKQRPTSSELDKNNGGLLSS